MKLTRLAVAIRYALESGQYFATVKERQNAGK